MFYIIFNKSKSHFEMFISIKKLCNREIQKHKK